MPSLKDVVLDASLLAEKRKSLHVAITPDRMEWALNKAFYMGNQWAFWNDSLKRVEALPSGSSGKWRVRLVNNQILPNVNTYVAQLTKTRPTIRATPNSGADRDMKAAEIAQDLFEYWWTDFHLEKKLQTALLNAQISQGYWKISWDPLAGKSLTVMTNPQTGQPLTDGELADVFKDELTDLATQQGQDPAQVLAQFEKTVYVGDIKVEVLSGEQVLLDPNAATFDECAYAICTHPLDPDEVKARWGVTVEADSSPSDAALPLAYSVKQKNDKKSERTTRNVYIGYFRPNPAMPKGRYVVWIEGPDKILEQADWPYPFRQLPLVKFPGIARPNSVLDEARVSHARPLQKELNKTLSQIVMHKNLTLKPQMVAPVGSLRQRLSDEPGAVFEYQPVAGLAPDWRPIPGLPNYVFEHLAAIKHDLGELFNSMPSGRDQLPARVDAGYAVELIQEAVADQLSTEIKAIEGALASAGELMASYANKYYTELRTMTITRTGGSSAVRKFKNSDIDGHFSFHAEAGSGLPKTRAGRTQQIKDLIEMQVISPQEALPYLNIGGLKGIQGKVEADEDHAYREIDKLLRGEPVNPQALQDAVQAVQSGQPNPETGQPFQAPQEIEAFIHNAGLQPLPYEDFQTHLTVLQTFMVGGEFDKLDSSIQKDFVTHYSQTRDTMIQIQRQTAQGQPIKTSLALKGTVGPTVAADILARSGVPSATPETMAEPPLETWVTDSIDKPNESSAGNNPLDQMQQMQAMQHEEEKHASLQAKAMKDAALAHLREQQASQAMIHAEELHAGKLEKLGREKQVH